MPPANGSAHGRSRSISEVIKSGRKRAQSVTATEVVETLKAPISWKLVVSPGLGGDAEGSQADDWGRNLDP